jgi:hypothetical protein
LPTIGAHSIDSKVHAVSPASPASASRAARSERSPPARVITATTTSAHAISPATARGPAK